jgi:hypothetical protein
VYSKNELVAFNGTMDALAAQLTYFGRIRGASVPIQPSEPMVPSAASRSDNNHQVPDQPFERAAADAKIVYDDLCTKPWQDMVKEWPMPEGTSKMFREGRRDYSVEQMRAYERATADAMVCFNTTMNDLSLRMVAWRQWCPRPAPRNGRNVFLLGHDDMFPMVGQAAAPVPTISTEALETVRRYLAKPQGSRGSGGAVVGPSRSREARHNPLSRAGRRSARVGGHSTIAIPGVGDLPIIAIPQASQTGGDLVDDLSLSPPTASPPVVSLPPPPPSPPTAAPPVVNLAPPTAPHTRPRARSLPSTTVHPNALAAFRYGGITRRQPPTRSNARREPVSDDDLFGILGIPTPDPDSPLGAAPLDSRAKGTAKSSKHPSKKGRKDKAPASDRKHDGSQLPPKSGKGKASSKHPSKEQAAPKAEKAQQHQCAPPATPSVKKRKRDESPDPEQPLREGVRVIKKLRS